MMKRTVLVISILLFSPLLFGLTPTQKVQQYWYVEQTDSDNNGIHWTLEPQDQLQKLTTTRLDENAVCLIDETLATVSWTFSKPCTDSDFMATREGNVIRLSGTFHGDNLDKEIRIDDTPWFQATSLALRSLMEPDCAEATF
jgi:hypothetical protein